MGSGVCGSVGFEHQAWLLATRPAEGVRSFSSVQLYPCSLTLTSAFKGSEQERLINAVGDMFLLNGKLDEGMQLWRYSPIQGPAMRKFEATCQVIV